MPGVKSVSDQRAMQVEKREMDAAVARVRDVIKNVSNNDIVLALHNYDLDVERTIQALCEHGASAVLDSWESTNSKSARNKRNRNKPAANKPATATPVVQEQQQQSSAAVKQSITNGHHTPITNGVIQNGYVGSTAPLPPRQQQQVVTNSRAPAPPASVAAPSSSAQYNNNKHAHNNNINHHQQQQHTQDMHDLMSTDPAVKKKAIAKEVKNLSKHDAVVKHAQSRFNEEMHNANSRMKRAFQELRDLLAQREAHVAAELAACQEEGTRILNERALHARQLHQRSERVVVMSENELNELRTDIKNFVHDRKYEEELGSSIRFVYEPDHALETLKNFGRVIPVKPLLANGQHKHSSHSSLVSSVGEDSGLGMISPVSPQEPKKPMASVECGGVVMKSDSLTPEQLELLNQRLRESLVTQGLSTDLFTGGSQPVSRRRPPPSGANGRANGRGPRNGKPVKATPAPALSILE